MSQLSFDEMLSDLRRCYLVVTRPCYMFLDAYKSLATMNDGCMDAWTDGWMVNEECMMFEWSMNDK